MRKTEPTPAKRLRDISDDQLRHVVGGTGSFSSGKPPKDPPKPPDGTLGG
jgi:hypothetical protein